MSEINSINNLIDYLRESKDLDSEEINNLILDLEAIRDKMREVQTALTSCKSVLKSTDKNLAIDGYFIEEGSIRLNIRNALKLMEKQ